MTKCIFHFAEHELLKIYQILAGLITLCNNEFININRQVMELLQKIVSENCSRKYFRKNSSMQKIVPKIPETFYTNRAIGAICSRV